LKGAGETELALEPSSEEFPYESGQRVLVYARRSRQAWSTACTRTRVATLADAEVAVLRALRDKRRGGYVSASVATAALVGAQRLNGIRVQLTGRGIAPVEMLTNAHGRFDTPWLNPGTYTLSVDDVARGLEVRRAVVISPDSRCVTLGSIVDAPASR
jgi:acetolactate synthase regulatory subunit